MYIYYVQQNINIFSWFACEPFKTSLLKPSVLTISSLWCHTGAVKPADLNKLEQPQTLGSAERDTQSSSTNTRYICSDAPLSWPFPQFFRTTKDELLYSTQRFVLTFPHFPGQLVWYYIFVMACHLFFLSFFFLISSMFFQRHACHLGDNPLCAAKRKGSVSGIMIWMHDLCSKASTTSSSSNGGPHADVSNSTFQGHGRELPKLVLLMQPGSSAQFRRSVFTFDPSRVLWEEGGHAWIPKHGTLEKARGMKGENRLLCRQSPFSANHSKSLFVLDPCSTPSPPHAHHPAAVIKHSFISLHPLVQFGHIIPCLSRGNLHKRPERTHLIYCVCKIRVAIQEGGEKYVMQ